MATLDENLIAALVGRRVVADTFRRLPPVRKSQIYRTALRLFAEYGYDGLAVDRLCREAGISKGSFFQYFETKSHLLEFVLLAFDRRVAEWVREIRAQETATLARERLASLFRAATAADGLDDTEREFYHFATEALRHSGVIIEGVDLQSHLRGFVREVVERGIQTGELRDDLPPDYLATIIGDLLHQVLASRPQAESADQESTVKMLIDGILA